MTSGSDEVDPIYWSDTGMLLECCGCEELYFRHDHWFSEWDEQTQDSYGREVLIPGIKTTYYPPSIKRARPEWLARIERSDRTLDRLLTEPYSALDTDLNVLAAIAARTAFDRATELLGVAPELQFGEKLKVLLSDGRIGATERDTLAVLIDAGSAAAHRGWMPQADELNTMMELIEAFLHRSLILGEGIQALRAAVPARRSPKPKVPRGTAGAG